VAPARSGVSLIFGSPALGLSDLPQAARAFIPEELPEDSFKCQEIPAGLATPGEVAQWLGALLDGNAKRSRFVVWQHVSQGHETAPERIEAAIELCRKREKRERRLRVLFVFDPLASWRWLSKRSLRRQEIEKRIGAEAVAALRCWESAGVAQWLRRLEQVDSEEVCAEIMRVTGGWPHLLRDLFRRVEKGTSPREAARTLSSLLSSEGEFTRVFRGGLGIDSSPSARRVLSFLQASGSVPAEMAVPDLIDDGGPLMSEEECSASLEFLHRMGCIHTRDEALLVVSPLLLAPFRIKTS